MNTFIHNYHIRNYPVCHLGCIAQAMQLIFMSFMCLSNLVSNTLTVFAFMTCCGSLIRSLITCWLKNFSFNSSICRCLREEQRGVSFLFPVITQCFYKVTSCSTLFPKFPSLLLLIFPRVTHSEDFLSTLLFFCGVFLDV